MNSARLIILLSLLLCGGGAAYLFQSGPEERIAMLVRDNNEAKAVIEIEAMLKRGEATPRLLRTLARLQKAAGQPLRGAEMMEGYLFTHPNDTEALSWLVDIHAGSSDPEGLIYALARVTKLQPTKERVSRLLGLYHLNSRFSEEKKALEFFENSGILDSGQQFRLAQLSTYMGDVPTALRVLRALDQKGVELESARKLLFKLLLHEHSYDEAANRSERWLKSWRKPWLTAEYTFELADAAPPEVAGRLARLGGILHPESRFYVAKTLADRGHGPVAAALLQDWPARDTPLTRSDIDNYFAAALAIGDPSDLFAKFSSIRSGHEPQAQAAFAEKLNDLFGLQVVARFIPPHSFPILSAAPILAIRLALYSGQHRLAGQLIASADRAAMSALDRQAWLQLALSYYGQDGTQELLNREKHRNKPSDAGMAAKAIPAALSSRPEFAQERASVPVIR